MNQTPTVLTLRQLNTLIGRLIMVPQTQNVWVTAELSDVHVRGHVYMEILEKDDAGTILAKCRATIWQSYYSAVVGRFEAATGQRFASGIKVMLRVSASYHPVYGMNLVVNDINPEYTMGDLLRRRREILARLQQEGVLTMNRELQWPEHAWRVAVISAPGAAGYGDFFKHLYQNTNRLRFKSALFEAVMQGEKSPGSIVARLEQIAEQYDQWDCVVIIRGGGSSSDLYCFDNYDLAAAIAQFPLPIIVGVGHDRDTTVLDYVGNIVVKTPTAAADVLIERGNRQLDQLRTFASDILQAASTRISDAKHHLGQIEIFATNLPMGAVQRADARLRGALLTLSDLSTRRISPAIERLNAKADTLRNLLAMAIQRQSARLDKEEALLAALSPQAVLARGYSITRDSEGHAITDASRLSPGDTITTTFATGITTSTVNR